MNKLCFGLLILPISLCGMEKLQEAVLKNDFWKVQKIISGYNPAYPICNYEKNEEAFKKTLESITITNLQNRQKDLFAVKNRFLKFFFGTIATIAGGASEYLLLSSDHSEEKGTHFITAINAFAIGGGSKLMYDAVTNKTNNDAYQAAVGITQLLAERNLISQKVLISIENKLYSYTDD